MSPDEPDEYPKLLPPDAETMEWAKGVFREWEAQNQPPPANSGAALRDAIEADEEADLREGEGKDEHP